MMVDIITVFIVAPLEPG